MKKILFITLLCSFCQCAQSLAQNIVMRLAGTGVMAFSGDGGPATDAKMDRPRGLCVDGAGNCYVADVQNYCVRKISAPGIMSTFAGIGTVHAYTTTLGGPATATGFNFPSGTAFDAAGNVYFTDEGFYQVFKVAPGGIVTLFAGAPGAAAYSGDGGPATDAHFFNPAGIAIDTAGNVYIADMQNHAIRKINTSGIISTVAGNGTMGFSGDGGPATAARLNRPLAVAVDANGIYIADNGNARVRKVDLSGNITTIAGTGITGYSGDGGPGTAAKIYAARGIAVSGGNVYFTDNYRIRMVDASGIISTFAGDGSPSTLAANGDGGPATAAHFSNPYGIAADAAGSIYITENGHSAVRKIAAPDVAPQFTKGDATVAVCKDSVAIIDSLLAVMDPDIGQTLIWAVATSPLHGAVAGSHIALSTSGVVIPSGFTYSPAAGYSGTDMFSIHVTDGINGTLNVINVMVDSCTGTTELAINGAAYNGAATIEVFPNPAQGVTTLNILSHSGGAAYVSVTDVTGRTVSDFTAQTNQSIPLRIGTSGLYFVSATIDGNRLKTKCLVIR